MTAENFQTLTDSVDRLAEQKMLVSDKRTGCLRDLMFEAMGQFQVQWELDRKCCYSAATFKFG